MKDLGKWAQGSRFYEQVGVMDDMNNSQLWAQGFRCNEQLRVVVDMKDFEPWGHDSKFYE